MGKVLSDAQIEQYERLGYVESVAALTAVEAAAYRRQLEAFEAARGDALAGLELHKSYLIFTWLHDLVCHPRILDTAEDILGPDILVFSSSLFIKEAGDQRSISWHQDGNYWSFEPNDVLTAWIALTPSTAVNGALRIAPGSHLHLLPHDETYAKDNMLTRGQTITPGIDEATAVDVRLRPGEMSLHHAFTAHASGANASGERRIGFAIRYIPTAVKQTGGPRLTAMLVRGTDDYHHYEAERGPAADLDPMAVAFHNVTMERHRATRYSTV